MKVVRIFFTIIIVISLNSSLFASVKPNFQLTGNKLPTQDSRNVQVLMSFPNDQNSYEIIGLMSDCSSYSEYSEFISVYKDEAAQYGANCIVVNMKTPGTNSSQFDGGLCVEATAIFLRQKVRVSQQQTRETPQVIKVYQSDCVNEFKEIIRLQKVVDSLKTELESCKKNN